MSHATPAQVLAELIAAEPDAVFVSTCGYLSRDVQQVADGPNFFYLVGSMGAALPLGLALAGCAPATRVVVIDGDGSFLMSLNCLPLVGAQSPGNLVHVVLDNGMHESTGGQRTVPTGHAGIRIPDAMRAVGYARALVASGVTETVAAALREPGPTGIHFPIGPRPTVAPRIATEPEELVRRTRKLLAHHRGRQ
jgi:phosphonopyruvate decarboxylase